MVDDNFPVRTIRSRFRASVQVGEFVEVSNNSDTDPCAWVGVVDKLGKTIKVRIRSAKINTTATAILAFMQAGMLWRSAKGVSRCLLLVGASFLQVKYPFHDSPDEWIKVCLHAGWIYSLIQLNYSYPAYCLLGMHHEQFETTITLLWADI